MAPVSHHTDEEAVHAYAFYAAPLRRRDTEWELDRYGSYMWSNAGREMKAAARISQVGEFSGVWATSRTLVVEEKSSEGGVDQCAVDFVSQSVSPSVR